VRKDPAALRAVAAELVRTDELDSATAVMLFDRLNEGCHVREIVGFEALMRLREADGVVIPPSGFIPLAEETGQITDLEWQLLPVPLACMKSFREKYPGLAVSVDFTSRTLLDETFDRKLLENMARTGFEYRSFVIEFVEREEMTESAETLLHRYRELADAGIGFCIDNFGEGTNSVFKLGQFTDVIRSIKISWAFTRQIINNQIMEQAVRALARTGYSFGKTVIAEGVEDCETLVKLMQTGPMAIQGYGLARPFPAGEVLPFLNGFYGKTQIERMKFPVE
jgi:EAL domain-containing protein (putative c-di-GMP-specific phosphodiesterase class I)